MSQSITLTVPDNIFLPLERIAQATRQPVEALLLTVLQASLPPLDGLSSELSKKLEALESLDDERLWQVMRETVAPALQRRLSDLLEQQQVEVLPSVEREELTTLQQQADLTMLRKARAAALLRLRGKRLPTLAELAELTAQTK